MSNILGDDPWGSGWGESPGQGSAFLTSSQLLNQNSLDASKNSDPVSVPESYQSILDHFGDQLTSVNELEQSVMDPLVAAGVFTEYQKSRLIDVLYEQNMLPPAHYMVDILGLIALEVEAPGTGDYVTLKFRRYRLPELPQNVIDILVSSRETISDPLSESLAAASLDDDPVLTDHSSIQKQQDKQEPTIDTSGVRKYMEKLRGDFKPLYTSKESISIREVPEKEGLLFKHTNYAITYNMNLGMNQQSGQKKVVRRYSDFVWLLEYLLKKYPFRVIPGLPPKKFSGSSPDSQFLQRRRRGLHRFLNQITKHPVLRAEPIVVTFLTVPTDIANWKRQAKIDYSVQFKGKKISTEFINSIWPTVGEEFLEKWKQCESSIGRLIEIWTKLVLLVERNEKRQQQIAFDNGKFVEMINRYTGLDDALYPHDDGIVGNSNKDDMAAINDSLGTIGEFFNKTSQALVDDSFAINTSTLEKFKNYLDYLYSLQELFERSKKLSTNNIAQLEARITENEAKYARLSTDDADIKGSDLAKLRQAIIADKQEMFQQLNRDWLIKSCCMDEYIMFQETQYLVSEAWVDWCRGRTQHQAKMGSLYDQMSGIIGDMPLNS